jgi:hypothetical protein
MRAHGAALRRGAQSTPLCECRSLAFYPWRSISEAPTRVTDRRTQIKGGLRRTKRTNKGPDRKLWKAGRRDR